MARNKENNGNLWRFCGFGENGGLNVGGGKLKTFQTIGGFDSREHEC
jgi:hypothetical protein